MRDLYPRTDELPGVEDTNVDEFVDRMKEEANFTMWAGVVAGSLVYEASPLITVGTPKPAFLLSKEERDEHAQKISGSKVYLVRQSVFLVKLWAGFCWGQDDKVRETMNLDPYPQDPGTRRLD